MTTERQEYKGCFVGIPLPEEFRQQFHDLLRTLREEIPEINPSAHHPHITIYYLGERSVEDLDLVETVVGQYKDRLAGTEIKIGDFGFFDNQYPALFLAVCYPEELRELRELLEKELFEEILSKNLPFRPHLTIVEIKTPQTLELLRQADANVRKVLDGVEWKFPLTEVVIYGKNPSKDIGQERLKSVKVPQ